MAPPIIDAVFLLPFAVALALLVRSRSRRDALFVFAAAIVAAAHFLAPGVDRPDDVVVILFGVDAKATPTALPEDFRGGDDRVDVRKCTVLRIDDTVPAEQTSDWEPTCPDALRLARPVADIGDALALARRLFAERAWSARLADVLLRRGRRIVIVIGPGATATGTSPAITSVVAAADAEDIRVDVVGSAQLRASRPQLQIVPNMEAIPSFAPGGATFAIDLEVGNVPATIRQMKRRCVLDGECVMDRDCGAGATCDLATATCSKSGPAGSANGGTSGACPAGGCVGTRRTAKLFVPHGDEGVHPETRDGHHVLRFDRSIGIGDFSGDSAVTEGWHSLRCHVESSGADGHFEADATRYLPSHEDLLEIVWGDGGRFELVNDPTKSKTREVRMAEVVRSAIIDNPMRPTDLAFGDKFFESDLLKSTQADALVFQRGVLVVVDGSKRFYDRFCSTLLQDVARGVRLVIAGPPPRTDSCSLPAHVALLPQGGRAVGYDRRPRVTFVVDPSRIGRMRYRAAADGESVTAGLEGRNLADGLLDVQKGIITRVASPSWTFDETKGTLQWTGTGQPFVNFTVAGWPTGEQASDVGLEQMRASSEIEDRVANAYDLDTPEGDEQLAARLGIEDAAVVFTYDIEHGKGNRRSAIARLLAHGIHVVVVPIATPFASAFEKSGSSTSAELSSALAGVADGPFADSPNVRRRLHVVDARGSVDFDGELKGLSLVPKDVENGVSAASDALSAFMTGKRAVPSRMSVRVAALGRFVDERLLPPGAIESLESAAPTLGGAPLLYDRLETNPQWSGAIKLFELADAPDSKDALPAQALAFGATYGRGHVLVLGYSPFEGAGGDFLYLVPWARDPSARLWVPEMPDVWGPRRLFDFGAATSGLEFPPANEPHLRRVSLVDERFLVLNFVQRVEPQAVADAIYVRRADGVGPKECRNDDRAVRLRLRRLSPGSHEREYELTPSMRMQLCGEDACVVNICREVCSSGGGAPCTPYASDDTLLLPARFLVESRDDLEDVDVMQQLFALAQYTGGITRPLGGGAGGRPIERRHVSIYAVTALALAVVFALMWTRTAARRLLSFVRLMASAAKEADAESFEPSAGAVRQMGEALGPASDQPPAGDFAAYRPLEPGDRTRAIVAEDVVMLSGAVSPSVAVVPRVVTRIETRRRRVHVFVDAGRAMRIPRGTRIPGATGIAPKVLGAARAVDVIAEVVWSAGGEVMVEVASARFHEPWGPHAGRTESDSIQAYLARATASRAIGDGLTLREVDPSETVIVVSDFLECHLGKLTGAAQELEAEGTATGFVRVVSPSEFSITELAWHGPSGILSDRSGMTSADLERAYRAFGAELQAKLGEARGGLLEVTTVMNADQVLSLVKESRLIEVLR
jgi:hypothetical protein